MKYSSLKVDPNYWWQTISLREKNYRLQVKSQEAVLRPVLVSEIDLLK